MLGKWACAATADVYTRKLRTGILSVWKDTVRSLGKLDTAGGRWACEPHVQEQPPQQAVVSEQPLSPQTEASASTTEAEGKRRRTTIDNPMSAAYNPCSKKIHWAATDENIQKLCVRSGWRLQPPSCDQSRRRRQVLHGAACVCPFVRLPDHS